MDLRDYVHGPSEKTNKIKERKGVYAPVLMGLRGFVRGAGPTGYNIFFLGFECLLLRTMVCVFGTNGSALLSSSLSSSSFSNNGF